VITAFLKIPKKIHGGYQLSAISYQLIFMGYSCFLFFPNTSEIRLETFERDILNARRQICGRWRRGFWI